MQAHHILYKQNESDCRIILTQADVDSKRVDSHGRKCFLPCTTFGEGLVIPAGTDFGHDCSFGAGCHIGPNCTFDIDCKFGDGCVIGEWLCMGKGCKFGKNVTVSEKPRIDKDVSDKLEIMFGKVRFGFGNTYFLKESPSIKHVNIKSRYVNEVVSIASAVSEFGVDCYVIWMDSIRNTTKPNGEFYRPNLVVKTTEDVIIEDCPDA